MDPTRRSSSSSSFDILSDDALVAIGSWVSATGAENYAKCLKVCRRFRNVLGNPALITERIRERTANESSTTTTTGIRTLEHLALWEAARECDLWNENRVGFDYGSISIEDGRRNRSHSFVNMFGVERRTGENNIENSMQRIDKIARILRRFPDCFLRIEAHTGTAAPPGIAERFSLARGMAVVRAFLDRMDTDGNNMDSDGDDLGGDAGNYFNIRDLATAERRLSLTPWGMQISEAAAASQHPYGYVARQGKGWVEIYLCHGEEIEMPSRPDFYQGRQRPGGHDTDSDDDGGDAAIIIHFGVHDDDDDDSSEESEGMEVDHDMGAIEDYEDSDDSE